MAPPMVGGDVLVCAPPHGGACRAGAWPASWPGVLSCCGAPLMVGRAPLCGASLMVGRAVLVPAWSGDIVWCCGGGLGLSSMPSGDRPRSVQVGGVLAGAKHSLFRWFGVVFAALQSGCWGGRGWWLGCGWAGVVCLASVGAVLVRGPPLDGDCCVRVWPPPW